MQARELTAPSAAFLRRILRPASAPTRPSPWAAAWHIRRSGSSPLQRNHAKPSVGSNPVREPKESMSDVPRLRPNPRASLPDSPPLQGSNGNGIHLDSGSRSKGSPNSRADTRRSHLPWFHADTQGHALRESTCQGRFPASYRTRTVRSRSIDPTGSPGKSETNVLFTKRRVARRRCMTS